MTAGTYDKLGPETSVEAAGTFVAEDLLRTVPAVLVQNLADHTAPLILHSCLYHAAVRSAARWSKG